MFFSKQRMRSRADTRYSERSRPMLRMSRQGQVSHVSTLPAYASLYRRFNPQRVRQEIHSAYDFKHITSMPHYPQSNGRAEQAVKVCKRLMQKAVEDRSDPFLALLAWRNTSSELLGQSPSQIMFYPRTRTSGILLHPRGPRVAATRGRRCGEGSVTECQPPLMVGV